MAEEGTQKTDNDLIFVGKPLDIDEDVFLRELKEIYESAMENDEDKTVKCIEKMVPTYKCMR